MKKKKYIVPRVLMLQMAINTHLAAGSFQANEPGAKQGDTFDEELYVEEEFDDSIPRLR